MSVRGSTLIDQSRAFRFYWLPSVASTILALLLSLSSSLSLSLFCACLSLCISVSVSLSHKKIFSKLNSIFGCTARFMTYVCLTACPTVNSAPKSDIFTHFNCLWSGARHSTARQQEMPWQTENCFSLLLLLLQLALRHKAHAHPEPVPVLHAWPWP